VPLQKPVAPQLAAPWSMHWALGSAPPAGTAVQATLLIDGMLFEMDAVAVRGGVRRAQ